jgi:hypothetical protein
MPGLVIGVEVGSREGDDHRVIGVVVPGSGNDSDLGGKTFGKDLELRVVTAFLLELAHESHQGCLVMREEAEYEFPVTLGAGIRIKGA